MDDLLSYGDKALTRPPRSRYDPETLPDEVDVPKYGTIHRKTLYFPNDRGLRIRGSFYGPDNLSECDSCVIYLHGNASCQLEGIFLVPIMLPLGISVCCLDLSGSGESEGERISLGHFEKNDVSCAISHLVVRFGIKKFSLWGRSMGAACSFLCLNNEPLIKGAVADSPFASLVQLIREIAGGMGIPSCFNSITISLLAKRIIQTSRFDIRDVNPIEDAKASLQPIMIIHGEKDDFIHPDHARSLYQAYAGSDKKLCIVPNQNHNSERPIELVREAVQFTARVLGKNVKVENIDISKNIGSFHFGGVEEMMEYSDYSE